MNCFPYGSLNKLDGLNAFGITLFHGIFPLILLGTRAHIRTKRIVIFVVRINKIGLKADQARNLSASGRHAKKRDPPGRLLIFRVPITGRPTINYGNKSFDVWFESRRTNRTRRTDVRVSVTIPRTRFDVVTSNSTRPEHGPTCRFVPFRVG